MNLSNYKYSVLEQHVDGAYWYHPRWTFDSREDAENKIRSFRKNHENRPMCYIVHKDELPEESCVCQWFADNVCRFSFAGDIIAEVKIIVTGIYEELEQDAPMEEAIKPK